MNTDSREEPPPVFEVDEHSHNLHLQNNDPVPWCLQCSGKK